MGSPQGCIWAFPLTARVPFCRQEGLECFLTGFLLNGDPGRRSAFRNRPCHAATEETRWDARSQRQSGVWGLQASGWTHAVTCLQNKSVPQLCPLKGFGILTNSVAVSTTSTQIRVSTHHFWQGIGFLCRDSWSQVSGRTYARGAWSDLSPRERGSSGRLWVTSKKMKGILR